METSGIHIDKAYRIGDVGRISQQTVELSELCMSQDVFGEACFRSDEGSGADCERLLIALTTCTTLARKFDSCCINISGRGDYSYGWWWTHQ